MRACLRARMFVCWRACVLMCAYVCLRACVLMCAYVCLHACMHACVRAFMQETMFINGAGEDEVASVCRKAREGNYPIDGRLMSVLDWIRARNLELGEPDANSEICAMGDKIIENGGGYNGDS
eukprot:GHVU01218784.1.p3 GENE.GHVU01218784.1~~GHVU01218784.1.p3  ORF type:complete len:123 (-),score=7.99 GHVU01218784.1:211-579(-)